MGFNSISYSRLQLREMLGMAFSELAATRSKEK